MITLFYSSRACSLASHITLEEAGAPYTPQNLPYRCAVIDRQMSPQTGEAMTKRDRRPVAFNPTISL